MALTDPYQNKVGPYRASDPETAKAAALGNFPRSGTQRRRVLHSIILAGRYGRTRDELAEELGLPDSSVDGRIWELETRDGWIESNGKKRRTRAGSMAFVLVLTAEALDTLLDPASTHLLP